MNSMSEVLFLLVMVSVGRASKRGHGGVAGAGRRGQVGGVEDKSQKLSLELGTVSSPHEGTCRCFPTKGPHPSPGSCHCTCPASRISTCPLHRLGGMELSASRYSSLENAGLSTIDSCVNVLSEQTHGNWQIPSLGTSVSFVHLRSTPRDVLLRTEAGSHNALMVLEDSGTASLTLPDKQTHPQTAARLGCRALDSLDSPHLVVIETARPQPFSQSPSQFPGHRACHRVLGRRTNDDPRRD